MEPKKFVLLGFIMAFGFIALLLLLAYCNGFGCEFLHASRISESNNYWRHDAKPFSILEHVVSNEGKITLVLLNNDAAGNLTLTDITAEANGYPGTKSLYNGGRLIFTPGETKSVEINVTGLENAESGSVYEFGVNISYISTSGNPTMQYGALSLLGKYT